MQAWRLFSPGALVIVVGIGMMVVSGCETNPYTGRSQLLMTSVSEEMQLGAQAYSQVKNDPKLRQSQDPREIEPVKRIAARIIEAAKRSKYAEMAQQFQWEVTVIKDDKTANAFALPGGKMAVYTGIFPMAKTEAGLAAVMGHEVVHALARHGAERMSQGQLTNVGLQVVGAAAGATGGGGTLGQAAMAALGVGAQVGVLLPFATAPQAAAVIHTDFERGFIRAETIAFDDLVACGGESGAKEKGKMRVEGKEYVVRDGDVMHFRFTV